MGRGLDIQKANNIYEKGFQHNQNGDWAAAESAFQKALVLYQKHDDVEMVAYCHVSAGNVCYNKKHYAEALQNWQTAVYLFESRLYNYFEAGQVSLDVGDLQFEQNKTIWGAGYFYEKALACFQHNPEKNFSEIGIASLKLGKMHYQWNHSIKALEFFFEAMRVFENNGQLGELGEVYELVANTYSDMKNLPAAKEYFVAAYDLYGQLRHRPNSDFEIRRQKVEDVLRQIARDEEFIRLQKIVKERRKWKVSEPEEEEDDQSNDTLSSISDMTEDERRRSLLFCAPKVDPPLERKPGYIPNRPDDVRYHEHKAKVFTYKKERDNFQRVLREGNVLKKEVGSAKKYQGSPRSFSLFSVHTSKEFRQLVYLCPIGMEFPFSAHKHITLKESKQNADQ